jgi:hypothetical protein
MRHSSTLVAAATLVLLAACSDDTTGPPKSDAGGMSARIAGTAWSAMSIVIDSAPPSLIIVRGTNATATLTLVIPADQGLGTQTVGSTTPIGAGLVIGSQVWGASRTQGGAGSITLTTVAPGHVAGTFQFTLAHEGASPAEQQVTSGRFDVKY